MSEIEHSAYASGAQGEKADSAVQPGDLGTAATADTSTGGNGATDDGKVAAFDSSGGLTASFSVSINDGTGNVASLTNSGGSTALWDLPSGSAGGFLLAAANNLSDLDNASTARTNLGLGETDNALFERVGIGVASPFDKLHIRETGATCTVRIERYLGSIMEVQSGNISSTIGTRTATFLNLRTTDTNRLNIHPDGNVAIGDFTPTEKLDVAGNAKASGFVKTGAVATADLPAAATAGAGARHFVTDSDTAASGNFGATFAGGGANAVPVYSDGTNWRIG